MTTFLFSAPISCEGEKEEKLSRNNYVVYLTNDTLSEMTRNGFRVNRLCHNSKITLITLVFHSKSKLKTAKSPL